ncbi:MAG: substrate-binding domain-containing protein [Anaerolineae bacterium]
MRRRGTIFIVLFILIAAAIVGASRFLSSQPPLEFTVAVDPLAQNWLQEAVNSFNNSQPVVNTRRIIFNVTPIDDPVVWQGQHRWTPASHPDAWLAASSLSLRYALSSGLSVSNVTDSLARTPLVWGGYVSRVDVLTTNGARKLDWDLLAPTLANNDNWELLGGQKDWQFVKLGFGQPGNKIGGLAALLSGAASYLKNADLSSAVLSQKAFRDWLLPVVKAKPSFSNSGITGDPALAMASGGPSRIEIALFPEAQWLLNLQGMNNQEEVRLSYPAYQFVLDFPLAIWSDTTPQASDRQTAVGLLNDWLNAEAQQATLPNYGLRPASSEPTADNPLFKFGIPSGIELNPTLGQSITPPSANELSGLIQWVDANR